MLEMKKCIESNGRTTPPNNSNKNIQPKPNKSKMGIIEESK
jgi:hypothetical protein